MWRKVVFTRLAAMRLLLIVIIVFAVNSYSALSVAGAVTIDFIAPNWLGFSWEKIVEKNGIVIETAGFKGSKFTAVKSTMRIDARLNDVANLVLFIDGCHEKSTVCEKIKKINFIDSRHYSQYVLSKFPWPLKKRDMFLKIRIHQEKKSGIVTVQGKAYQNEDLNNTRYIRINDMDIQWRLIPQKEGKVLIEHYIHSNPGGIIPAWIFNDAVTSTPLATLGNIKRILSLPKYQQRDVPFIFEPIFEPLIIRAID